MEKITTIYQLKGAMCELVRNPDLSLETKIKCIHDAFSAFMINPGFSTYSLASYAGKGGSHVQVTYEIDSDGDVCELKVFSDQGEITQHLHGNDLSRIEDECSAACIAELVNKRDEARIDNYEANQECA